MADLALEGVCKGWDFPVLDNISLEIAEGEFFVLVGPSGAGKTTTLRIVSGLENPDAGKINMGGKDVTRVPPYLRGAAMTFESYALYPQLSVYENIASPLRARKMADDAIKGQVQKVAELLMITELLQRKPGEISGGQKQRTALGRTLVATPKVFLLDEPLSHLDAKIRIELREQFHTLEELRRTATLYVTHDYAEALSLGDRVGVLSDGVIQQIGTPNEIYERPNSITVAEQFGQPGINLLEVSLQKEGDDLFAQAGKVSFKVNPAHHKSVEGANEGLTIGIRPQFLKLARDKGEITGKVHAFQSLGSYGVLTIDCEGTRLQVLAEAESELHMGDVVNLVADDKAHTFFNKDGRSLLHAN